MQHDQATLGIASGEQQASHALSLGIRAPRGRFRADEEQQTIQASFFAGTSHISPLPFKNTTQTSMYVRDDAGALQRRETSYRYILRPFQRFYIPSKTCCSGVRRDLRMPEKWHSNSGVTTRTRASAPFVVSTTAYKASPLRSVTTGPPDGRHRSCQPPTIPYRTITSFERRQLRSSAAECESARGEVLGSPSGDPLEVRQHVFEGSRPVLVAAAESHREPSDGAFFFFDVVRET